MSVYQQTDITCRCGHTSSVKVVHGVNIDRLPEVRDDILNGTFHTTLCPSCGTQSVVEKEFLYSDFGRNAFYKVKPRKARHQWEAASQELEEDLSKIPKDLTKRQLRHRRVVFGLGELREKLIAEDAGIDDRLVELLKVFLVYDHPFLLQKARLRLQLDGVRADRLMFVAFHDHSEGAFEVTMARSVFDDITGRRNEIEAWLNGAHKRSNILKLKNDHWVNMWRWSPQTTALRDLERYAETARTGGEVDLNARPFQQMLDYLPRGSHLPGWAKRAMRDIYEYAQSDGNTDVMDRTFEIRFDMGLDDDWARNNDPDDIDTLWDLLRDLPDANVEGNTFISSMELDVGKGGGWYSPRTHEIGIGSRALWAREGFEDVVRHEVGHAVQEKRDRTQDNQVTAWLEDEFGWVMMNGWDSDIDAWVDLMGGYGDMTSAQVRQVRQTLKACLGRGGEWSPPNIPFVPADHPWRRSGFGPRRAFQQTGANWYENHERWHRHNGKAFFVNFYYQRFMAVNEAALALVSNMPSSYAAMSPFEFFAELYALYYDLDDPLRGNIPARVSAWLQANIGDPDAA